MSDHALIVPTVGIMLSPRFLHRRGSALDWLPGWPSSAFRLPAAEVPVYKARTMKFSAV